MNSSEVFTDLMMLNVDSFNSNFRERAKLETFSNGDRSYIFLPERATISNLTHSQI